MGRITSLQRIFKREPPNISSCDSGNGSVSSTSSVSSSDSQASVTQDQFNTLSIPTSLPLAQSKADVQISPTCSTEEKGQRNNPGVSNHLKNGLNTQELNDSAIDEIENKDKKTHISSTWRTKLKPPTVIVDKAPPCTVHHSRQLNQLIGKFETAKTKTEKIGNDNRTVSKFGTSSQIKVKLKSPEMQCIPEKNASSCENCELNQNHSRSHNDNHAQELPHFVKEMIDSKAFPGDSVRFDVEFTGNPEPEVTWYFEEDLVSESPRHAIQSFENGTCSLIIKDVSEDDDGDYFCKIVNNLGQETCSAELIVYGAI